MTWLLEWIKRIIEPYSVVELNILWWGLFSVVGFILKQKIFTVSKMKKRFIHLFDNSSFQAQPIQQWMLASKIYLSNITFFETLYNIYLKTIYKISSRRSWSVLQFIGFTVIAQRFERKCIWQGCEIPHSIVSLGIFPFFKYDNSSN